MTATLSKMTASRERYFFENYEAKYTDLDNLPSTFWLGKGAAKLSLTGEVKREDFANLLAWRGPDGKPLTLLVAGKEPMAGTDVTLSVPPDVSLLFAVGPHEVRIKIARAVLEAARLTGEYVEQNLAITRRGRDGKRLEPLKGICAAGFLHVDNRDGQPFLHVHLTIAGVGLRQDGRFGGVANRILYDRQLLLGAYFRSALSASLEHDLYLNIVDSKHAFQVAGIPESARDALTGSRRKAILESLEARGESGAKDAEKAALRTRKPKEHVPLAERLKAWEATGQQVGFTATQVRALIEQGVKRDQGYSSEEVVDAAFGQVIHCEGRFTAQDVLHRAALHAPGTGAKVIDLNEGIRKRLQDEGRYQRAGKNSYGQTIYSTDEQRAEEEELWEEAAKFKESDGEGVDRKIIDKLLGKKKWAHLSKEQRECATYLTGDSSRLVILDAPAGTGKDKVLEASAAIWKKAGYRVLGTSQSIPGAARLERDTGLKTKPAHRLYKALTLKPLKKLGHHLRQIGRAALNKPTWQMEMPKLGPKTVVVVNDAEQMGFVKTRLLLAHVQGTGAKLVLVGDRRHGSRLGHSWLFAALGDKVGLAPPLREVKRPTPGIYQEAAQEVADGHVHAALVRLARAGQVTLAEGSKRLRETALASWRKEGLWNPKDHVLLADSWQDTERLNRQAQRARWMQSQIGFRYLWVDPSDVPARFRPLRQRIRRFLYRDLGLSRLRPSSHFKVHEGDRVLVTQDSGILKLRSGDMGTVTHIMLGRHPQITVRLDNGRKVTFYRDTFDALTLGYALNPQQAQGRTVKHAYAVLWGSITENAAYVQLSRAKESLHVFLDKSQATPKLQEIVRQQGESQQQQQQTQQRPHQQRP